MAAAVMRKNAMNVSSLISWPQALRDLVAGNLWLNPVRMLVCLHVKGKGTHAMCTPSERTCMCRYFCSAGVDWFHKSLGDLASTEGQWAGGGVINRPVECGKMFDVIVQAKSQHLSPWWPLHAEALWYTPDRRYVKGLNIYFYVRLCVLRLHLSLFRQQDR